MGRKLLVATTHPITPWALMRGQLAFLAKQGFDVLLVSAPGDLLEAAAKREGVRFRSIPIEREIRLSRDLLALAKLIMLFRSERPAVSIVSTPKAGLLGGLAAFITRVPRRVYLLRGLRMETTTGATRWALWLMEWISLHVAHEVVAVSPSLLAVTHDMRLLGQRRGRVLGRGASNGVDVDRFSSTPERVDAGRALRCDLGIPVDAFVFGFIGRLVIDKGVTELAEAFTRLCGSDSTVWLLFVGPPDAAGLGSVVSRRLESCERVRFTGWLDEPSVAYQSIDALVLPTYREGFPNVCIEAAAAGKPVITTTATGAVDAITDGVTGSLVPPRDVDGLHDAMAAIAGDPQTAAAMGDRGREFAAGYFSNEQVWGQISDFLKADNSAAYERGVSRA